MLIFTEIPFSVSSHHYILASLRSPLQPEASHSFIPVKDLAFFSAHFTQTIICPQMCVFCARESENINNCLPHHNPIIALTIEIIIKS